MVRQLDEARKHRRRQLGRRGVANGRPETRTQTRDDHRVVDDGAGQQSDQQRRHSGQQCLRLPHHDDDNRRDEQTERFGLADMLQRLDERHHAVEAKHIAELHQEQQYRGGILETRHHRMRRELDQRAQPHQAEQQLKYAPQQDDREDHREGQRQPAGAHHRRLGMHEAVQQDAKEERGGDPRRVEGRGLVAQQDADDADDQRGYQPGKRTAGEVFVAERDECEHAEAHRQRDSDARGDESADDVAADAPVLGVRHRSMGAVFSSCGWPP